VLLHEFHKAQKCGFETILISNRFLRRIEVFCNVGKVVSWNMCKTVIHITSLKKKNF
jgi:hypothetical protein